MYTTYFSCNWTNRWIRYGTWYLHFVDCVYRTTLGRRKNSNFEAVVPHVHLLRLVVNIEGGLVLSQEKEAPTHLLQVGRILRIEACGRLK